MHICLLVKWKATNGLVAKVKDKILCFEKIKNMPYLLIRNCQFFVSSSYHEEEPVAAFPGTVRQDDQ